MSSSAGEFSTISDVSTRLFQVELDHGFFDEYMHEVPIWERIRFDVHNEILVSLDITGQPHADHRISKGTALYKLCRNLAVKNPLFSDPSELLFWGHERRKRREDGYWMDLFCDPIIEVMNESFTYLEQLHEGTHLTPAVTDNMRYLDFIQYAPHVFRQFGAHKQLLSESDRETLRTMEAAIESVFGTALDLVELGGRELLRRRVRLPLYEAVLRRVNPSVAILVVSYGRETFIEACQRRNIPTIELQHGMISEYDASYAYPGERTKRMFPEYFFSFGEFWDDAVELPLPTENVFPVGYPYIELQRERYSDVPATDKILFSSQGSVGARLSKFAIDFAEAYPDLEVVYKLHPGEYGRWREDYPWLVDAPLTVLTDEEPLYKLFAESAAQVGVYSTTLYEGLCYNLDTYVVGLPGSEALTPLVDRGGAQFVHTPDELGRSLNRGTDGPAETEPFFRSDALKHIEEALNEVRRRERKE